MQNSFPAIKINGMLQMKIVKNSILIANDSIPFSSFKLSNMLGWILPPKARKEVKEKKR